MSSGDAANGAHADATAASKTAAPPQVAVSSSIEAPSPLCARLRSKKYYLLGRLPLSADDILDGSQHCWCQRTQQAVGPDADIVHPNECVAGRVCHEPLGVARP